MERRKQRRRDAPAPEGAAEEDCLTLEEAAKGRVPASTGKPAAASAPSPAAAEPRLKGGADADLEQQSPVRIHKERSAMSGGDGVSEQIPRRPPDARTGNATMQPATTTGGVSTGADDTSSAESHDGSGHDHSDTCVSRSAEAYSIFSGTNTRFRQRGATATPGLTPTSASPPPQRTPGTADSPAGTAGTLGISSRRHSRRNRTQSSGKAEAITATDVNALSDGLRSTAVTAPPDAKSGNLTAAPSPAALHEEGSVGSLAVELPAMESSSSEEEDRQTADERQQASLSGQEVTAETNPEPIRLCGGAGGQRSEAADSAGLQTSGDNTIPSSSNVDECVAKECLLQPSALFRETGEIGDFAFDGPAAPGRPIPADAITVPALAGGSPGTSHETSHSSGDGCTGNAAAHSGTPDLDHAARASPAQPSQISADDSAQGSAAAPTMGTTADAGPSAGLEAELATAQKEGGSNDTAEAGSTGSQAQQQERLALLPSSPEVDALHEDLHRLELEPTGLHNASDGEDAVSLVQNLKGLRLTDGSRTAQVCSSAPVCLLIKSCAF